ncbi:MAG: Dabb family protein [Bacteroidota bacterium]|nr:stress protein [Odoribacter sp.]MDP3642508.1 Dabb family protein [Bacteroidota bacterium]
MENRRSFVMKIAAGMATTGFIPASGYAIASEVPMKNIFVHHVFFWLKEPKNPEARAEFEKGLHELIKVPQIQSSHIGAPVESPREVVDDSFTYSFLTFFKNKEDQDVYQTHPIHLKFIEDCQHLWEKVIVYDAVD